MSKEIYKYEIRHCTEEGETVTRTFYSEFHDLTVEDDRCPYSIGSQEYLIMIEISKNLVDMDVEISENLVDSLTAMIDKYNMTMIDRFNAILDDKTENEDCQKEEI